MSSIDDIVTALQNNNQNVSAQFEALIAAIQTVLAHVEYINTGTFTCSAAATTTVPQTGVASGSFIVLVPTNAAAATLMAGANSLYLSARTAGTSFAFTTAAGGSAAGTEQFLYLIITIGS